MSFVSLDFFTKHISFQRPWNRVNNLESILPLPATSGMVMPMVTNLRAIRGKRVLFVVDSDNWDYSLKRHGLRLRYRRLLNRLNAEAERVFPVAVLTSAPGDSRRARHLENCGWRVVSIPWGDHNDLPGDAQTGQCRHGPRIRVRVSINRQRLRYGIGWYGRRRPGSEHRKGASSHPSTQTHVYSHVIRRWGQQQSALATYRSLRFHAR